jgi:anti-anti-sigma factor
VLSQIGMSAVVVDLARVSRIDARGLGLLLELREQFQSNGVEFLLVNVTNLVEQIFKMTCLDSVFAIVQEEEIRSRNSLEPLMV